MSSALVDINRNLPREAKQSNDSELDRIYKFYHADKKRIELTAVEEKRREQIEHAWLLLTRLKPQKHVVDELVGMFGCSQSNAFNVVRYAMIIFGDPRMQVKEAKRAIAEQQFLMGAEKALAAGNDELHLKYMKEYAEINGLKNAEVNENGLAELMKKLKPTTIILNFRKEEVEREANRLHEQLTQDAEFEEM